MLSKIELIFNSFNGSSIDMNSKILKDFFVLQVLFLVYSLCGVCSKVAAGYPLFSTKFSCCYVLMVCLLVLYAIGWQQVLKRLPLSLAFSNKAITVLWGMIWSTLIFGETVNMGNIFGAGLIIIGIILYSLGGNYNDIR